MQTTPNYNYNLPEYSDSADIAVLNANFSSIDANEYRIEGKLNALGNDIALPYDNTATYNVGDYTIYNNALYRCITAITTAEDFDSTKWTAITIGGELKSHDTRISTLEAGVDLEKSATNSFDDGIDSYFKKVVSSIVPVQAGSGTPSPTNVRAISGFTECTVTDTNGTDTNTATISFGSAGTVYGGYVDLISGKLVVDSVMVDLGSLTWGINAYGASSPDIKTMAKKPATTATKANLMCEQREVGSFSQIVSAGRGGNYIGLYTDGYLSINTTETDATAFKNSMNGIKLVYELATPQSYQLTPAQLRSLVGTNNLTSSTGEVTEVEYITNDTIAWLLDLIRVQEV